MAMVRFTQNLRRHVECPSESTAGKNLREVLDNYFARHPKVRGYLLDDQGSVRHHMVVFLDAQQIRDRRGLSDPVHSGSEIYIMQALSGGQR